VPIISPSGGGGGLATGHGFAATLNNDTAFANGATIKPDSIFRDTDSYYSAATGIATIPAGLGGFYIVSYYAETITVGVTALHIKLSVSGAFDNVIVSSSVLASEWDGLGAVVAYLPAGNAVHGILQTSGTDPCTLVANQTGFGLAFLGSA
jgi:hypothetical protein